MYVQILFQETVVAFSQYGSGCGWILGHTSGHIKGPWTPKLIYSFFKKVQFSDNFDSNLGTLHFVNTEKFALAINDLRK